MESIPEICKLHLLATLPIHFDRGHIMVDIVVNGHPLHFMVDTGGLYSAISRPAANAIGTTAGHDGPALEMKDAEGASSSGRTRSYEITFSHVKIDGPLIILDSLPPGQDGLLAPDLLRNFGMELDFKAQVINLFKQPPCDDHVVYWTSNFAKLPINITRDGHIRVPVTVDGVEEEALLDTGSPATVIGNGVLAKIGGTNRPTGKTVPITGGNGGKEVGTNYKLDSLTIGNFRWLNHSILAVTSDAAWRSEGAQLLIGLDIMNDLHLFIDYEHSQIFVSPR